MTTIGIVGTGMLGEAVGLHLMDVGYKVIVFNRTKETRRLKEKGGLKLQRHQNRLQKILM